MNLVRDLLVPFAKTKSGQWVGPHEVARGLSCNCICPTCGEHLVAKQGEEVIWHFAHRSHGGNSGCGEGAIHLLAKEVLEESKGKCIRLPGGRSDDQNYLMEVQSEAWIEIAKRRVDALVTVRHRSRIGRVSGQLASLFPYESLGTGPIAIEITVANPKDSEYVSDMERADLSSLEIEIPPQIVFKKLMQRRNTGTGGGVKSLIRSIVLSGGTNRRWLYNKQWRHKE